LTIVGVITLFRAVRLDWDIREVGGGLCRCCGSVIFRWAGGGG